ncbi:MAG: type II toxin-antitoxin system RelE/ParE family toxin [Candidatus Micrarchaeota archaeon]
MTYELIFDKNAIKFLEGLPTAIRERIFNKISAAKENPNHFFERLENRSDYKLRVGDYRVIADIDHNLKRIEITLIDHRKRVYKRI